MLTDLGLGYLIDRTRSAQGKTRNGLMVPLSTRNMEQRGPAVGLRSGVDDHGYRDLRRAGQSPRVQHMISYLFLGLSVVTGIIMIALLPVLDVEKGWRPNIAARRADGPAELSGTA
ncbi:hypothetical protein AB0H71_02135 [Nocardia sp. NPDC050697]|uniref:hypothetical protein n=1 Tax=Nocardia sp. NPDC050697 TaxID=3155158 RepID=UPI0033EDD028